MSVIDRLNVRIADMEKNNETNASSLRQSWLKALEHTGLQDALEATRRFDAGRSPSSLSTQQSPSFEGRAVLPDMPEGNESYSLSNNSMVKDSVVFKVHGIPPDVAMRLASPFEDAIAVPVGILPLQEYSDGAALKQSETSSVDRDVERLPAAIENPWPSKKVTLLEKDSGLEVWVRDARLSPPDLIQRLSGLRQSMARLGISLVRLTLNGTEITSFLERTSYNENKEK